MKRLVPRMLTILLLASALPARAVDVGGSLDTSYWRGDNWSGGTHDVSPGWEFGGNLSLSGTPFRPEILMMNGDVDYHQFHSLYTGGDSQNNSLTWGGAAQIYSESPVNGTITASRTNSDFATQGVGIQTGQTLVTTEGLNLNSQVKGLPSLNAQLLRTDADNVGFGGQASTTQTTMLSAGAMQSFGPHQYSLQYQTSWNQGTWADTNYRFHSLVLNEQSQLSRDLQFMVSDNYLLRDPTVTSAANPRLDDNAFTASLFWHASADLQPSLTYSYNHSVVSAPGVPGASDVELLGHTASVGTTYRASQHWTLVGNLNFTDFDNRAGAMSSQGTGETVGAGAIYSTVRGGWNLSLQANGNVGVLEVSGTQSGGGGTNGAYGLSGGGSASRTLGAWNLSAAYLAGFSENLTGALGRSVTQNANFTADTLLWGSTRFTNQLLAFANRQELLIGGDSFNRSITYMSTLSWRRYSLTGSAGLSDGLANGTGTGLSDGLFIPVSYDTHSRFASIGLGTSLARGLSTNTIVRYLSTDMPGRPSSNETDFLGSLNYVLGLFTFTLTEQYSAGGYGDITQQGNVFMARIARSFGASL